MRDGITDRQTDGRTNRQTDRQTNGWTIQLLDAPADLRSGQREEVNVINITYPVYQFKVPPDHIYLAEEV